MSSETVDFRLPIIPLPIADCQLAIGPWDKVNGYHEIDGLVRQTGRQAFELKMAPEIGSPQSAIGTRR